MADPEAPNRTYSMTRRAGDMLFLSGFGPVEDMEVVGDDIAAQTALTMDHMTAALKDERATWADVVRSTCSSST